MPPAKILIVEDEILIAETIKTYLNERGHIITEIAISYEEAIDAYQREQPDVILLDVRLYGKKSGIDVAEYLDEIVYISSNHVYINIHMKDESTHIIRNSISQILDELNPEIFMQSHRGYIINLNYVESYNKMHVIVAKEEIPISRSRRSEMKTKMENLKSQL